MADEVYADSLKPLQNDPSPRDTTSDGSSSGAPVPPGGSRMHVPAPMMMMMRKPGDSAPGTPRSRSHSPSIGRATGTTMDSSLSSLEDVDLDILTDRAALDDLSESQRLKLQTGLLPVLERMTDDTLEDIHAFSDITARSQSSRVSVCSTNNMDVHLERLDECDEEEEMHFSDPQQVILTNMENLKLQEEEEESMSQFSEAAVGGCT